MGGGLSLNISKKASVRAASGFHRRKAAMKKSEGISPS